MGIEIGAILADASGTTTIFSVVPLEAQHFCAQFSNSFFDTQVGRFWQQL